MIEVSIPVKLPELHDKEPDNGSGRSRQRISFFNETSRSGECEVMEDACEELGLNCEEFQNGKLAMVFPKK